MPADKPGPEGTDDATKAEFEKLARTMLNLVDEASEPAKPVQQQQPQPPPGPEKKDDG